MFAIVFQIKILSALSVGDIRQYDLLPLAFSKSLSEKLYLHNLNIKYQIYKKSLKGQAV